MEWIKESTVEITPLQKKDQLGSWGFQAWTQRLVFLAQLHMVSLDPAFSAWTFASFLPPIVKINPFYLQLCVKINPFYLQV